MRKLGKNRSAVSNVVSSIILIGATVAISMTVIVWSNSSINTWHNRMGERIAVEKVLVVEGQKANISVYVHSIGLVQVKLAYANVNNKLYTFTEGMSEISAKGMWLHILFVDKATTTTSGEYKIHLVSSSYNEFLTEGKVQ